MRYDARFRTAWEWVIFPLKAWFRTLHLGQNLAAVVSRVHVFCSLKDTQEAVEQPTSKLLCSMLSQIWEQGRMDQDWTVNGDLSAKRGKWSLMRTSTWKPPFLRCGVRWRTLSNNAHITRGKCLILLFIMVNEKDPSMGSPMQIIMAILYDDCIEGWLLTIVTPTFFQEAVQDGTQKHTYHDVSQANDGLTCGPNHLGIIFLPSALFRQLTIIGKSHRSQTVRAFPHSILVVMY